MGPALAFLGAVFFGVGATASLAYVVAVNLARIAILSLVSKALAPKIDLTQAASDKLLTIRSSFQPQAFVYGEDMLSGPLLFANTAGEGNKELHRLIALTGREIEAFVGFRIDDTDIEIGVDIASANATVSGGQFADVVDIETRTGTASQTALAPLVSAFPDLWTSAHTGRGWALLYTQMRLEGNNTAFESGIPQNIRALVQGSKVYDPRLAQDVDDPTTWTWSANPALILADFLIWQDVGLGEDPERVDYDLVAAAADICEEQVIVPGEVSTSDTQDRYTCNFTFYADQQRFSVLEIIVTSMLGRLIFSQGKWRMWAGAALPATVTLTEANLAGGISLQASTPSGSRYNRIRGKFVDPSRNYTANPYPEQRDSNYETDDNEVKYQTYDQNACNNTYEAQRAAIIRLRQSRMQRVLNFDGNWSCFRVQPGTTVEISIDELGFAGEKFFVTEWNLDKEGRGVNLVCVQEDDAVWTDPDLDDYVTRSPTGDLVFTNQGGIQLSGASLINISADTCYSGVTLAANGKVYYLTAAGVETEAGVPPGEWRGGELGDYWARITIGTGDSLYTGTDGVWLPLSADVAASIRRTTLGITTAVVTIEIAEDSAGAVIVASADFFLSAEKSEAGLELKDLGTWTVYDPAEAQLTVPPPGSLAAGDILLCFIFSSVNTAASPVFQNAGQWTQVLSGSTGCDLWVTVATGTDGVQTNATPPGAGAFEGYILASFHNPTGLVYNTSTLKSFFNGTSSADLAMAAAAGIGSPGAGNFLAIATCTLTKTTPTNTNPTLTPTWSDPWFEGATFDYYTSPRGVVWGFGYAPLDNSNTAITQQTVDTLGETYARYGQTVVLRFI